MTKCEKHNVTRQNMCTDRKLRMYAIFKFPDKWLELIWEMVLNLTDGANPCLYVQGFRVWDKRRAGRRGGGVPSRRGHALIVAADAGLVGG